MKISDRRLRISDNLKIFDFSNSLAYCWGATLFRRDRRRCHMQLHCATA